MNAINTVQTLITMRLLPELNNIVVGYAKPVYLHDWIPRENINNNMIWANPAAYEAGWLDFELGIQDPEKLPFIARNPAAAKIIYKNIDLFVRLPEIWMNPKTFRLILAKAKELGIPINVTMLCANPFPPAVEYLEANYQWYQTSENIFSMNPGAEKILVEKPWTQHAYSTDGNPAPGLMEKTKWRSRRGDLSSYISHNSDPWAIEYMRTHRHLIEWGGFSMNPAIFTDVSGDVLKILTED